MRHHSLRAELGKLVRDEATQRVGILMDVFEYSERVPPQPSGGLHPPALAFIRPEHGGREWEARTERITVLERADARQRPPGKSGGEVGAEAHAPREAGDGR